MSFSQKDSALQTLRYRKTKNYLMTAVIALLSLIAIVPLFMVFFHIIQNGFASLSWNFFTKLPAPIGETDGGMANCILGSLILISIGSLIAVPIGIFCGLYLSEYKNESLTSALRWIMDLLMSIPSIVMGLFIYTAIVIPSHSFSALAGGVALSLLMLPIVAKTTEEVLKLTPVHVREAGLALGLSRWRVILFIVLRGKTSAVMTGVVLALGRIAGETAPLLVTAFGNRNWPQALMEPTPSLPVQIYNYAISPYNDWHSQAWAGALTLVVLIFSINITTRLIFSTGGAGRNTQ
ncbi:MAG: phosphate ABC transporter permease PstA [Pseudobdellovibrio sp.]